ncbi:bZIP transcription factor protein [Rutstroemia sp. NJR-2017a BBW]|nr:bZIP transcription factor protein [Rutstroemia sp. NJR-2017a BBW]
MATGQFHHAASPEAFLMPGDMSYYDGTSSESSASSPLNTNTFDHVYGGNTYMTYPTYPMQYQPNGVPMGLIPVELDIEGLYEDHDRRRRKNGSEKVVASHVHSRRRAQNRASQRAFRDRKEKHMRDLEQRLGELEGRHNDLSRSYESLQVEYSSVKQELDRLRKEKLDASAANSPESVGNSDQKVWNESGVDGLDPLLFDVSAYCYEQEESGQRSKE